MKKIFLILTVLVSALTCVSQVQFGGVIKARNNAGAIGEVRRNLNALYTYDSILHAQLAAGIPVTGSFSLDSNNTRVYVKVSVQNWPAVQAVTGTFWQATQPVSGTFWQTTQPVSIASMPTTAVTGTFFQATQPVSGTFWQTTQPISHANLDAALSTLAKESGGNLAAIKADVDKLPALGQTTKSASQPVVTATDEIVLQVTGQSAQTATVNNILTASSGSAATDVSQYRSFAIQVVSTGSGGTFIFEGSNDNTNFQAIPLFSQASVPTTPIVAAITATSSSLIYVGAINFSFIRLRIATTITGGSIQAFSAFSRNAFSPTVQSVATNTNNFNVNVGTASAASDTKTNPTAGQILTYDSYFNGTNWDRKHGNWNTTTGDAGTKLATFNGATQTNFDSRGAVITVLCGTVSGSTPTMTGQLQWSPDAGTTWINYGAASGNATATANTITFIVYPTNSSTAGGTPAALTLGSTQSVQINGILPRTWRIVYTLGGSSPSFAITAVYVNYQL